MHNISDVYAEVLLFLIYSCTFLHSALRARRCTPAPFGFHSSTNLILSAGTTKFITTTAGLLKSWLQSIRQANEIIAENDYGGPWYGQQWHHRTLTWTLRGIIHIRLYTYTITHPSDTLLSSISWYRLFSLFSLLPTRRSVSYMNAFAYLCTRTWLHPCMLLSLSRKCILFTLVSLYQYFSV